MESISVAVLLIILIILYMIYKNTKKDKLVVYTQNITSVTGSIDPTETFTYPTCASSGTNEQCVMENGSIYKDYKYNTTDSRCFKSLDDTSVDNLLKAYNRTYDLNAIGQYFTDCGNGFNMYLPTSGRYVRVQRNAGNTNPIKLSRFDAYNTSSTIIVPIDIHRNPATNITLETGNSLDTNPAYIQLDLGSDIMIKSITIEKLTTDTTGQYIRDCTLYIIKNPISPSSIGEVVFQMIINSTTVL